MYDNDGNLLEIDTDYETISTAESLAIIGINNYSGSISIDLIEIPTTPDKQDDIIFDDNNLDEDILEPWRDFE